MNFTIDRSKWRCGGDDGKGWGETQLLNEEGFMCCLGQCSLQSGLSEEEIYRLGEPAFVNGYSDNIFKEDLRHLKHIAIQSSNSN